MFIGFHEQTVYLIGLSVLLAALILMSMPFETGDRLLAIKVFPWAKRNASLHLVLIVKTQMIFFVLICIKEENNNNIYAIITLTLLRKIDFPERHLP